ncbi:hypothetical protein [Leifsonia sp. 71-9]|uniref:hypothetical protein n=1 Tax=Leifsonia sp. 71-9 TaxID=1895934 RepID=UPI0025C2D87A|nr:hypothetical protein [Leifsonia sp. 71-9]
MPNDANLIREAAPFASNLSAALLVADSTSDAGSTAGALTSLNTTSLTLYGSFTASFKAGLPSLAAVTLEVGGATSFARTSQAVGSLPAGRLVVASSAVANSAAIGSSMATLAGSGFVVLDGSESSASIQTFFASRGSFLITVIGSESTLPLHLLPPLNEELFTIVSPTAPTKTAFSIALDYVRSGTNGTKLWTTPSDQPTALPLVGLAAKRAGAVFAPAGTSSAIGTDSAAAQYAKAWGPELTEVVLAGTNVTSTQLSSVASSATTVTRTATPDWTVTDVQLGASNYTFTVSAKAGAATYKALTLNDEVVASSSTTSITVPGLPGTVTAIAAYNAAGAQIDVVPTRINQYQQADDRPSALVSSVRDSGKHHLNWLDDSSVPRLITRYVVDIFADDPMNPTGNPSTAEVVAITCGSEFTSPAMDKTKQWVYQVDMLSTSGTSCNSAGSALTAPVGAGANIPMLEWPAWASAAARKATGPDAPLAQPGYTVADFALSQGGQATASLREATPNTDRELLTESAESIVENGEAASFVGGQADAQNAITSRKSDASTFGAGDDMPIMRVFYMQYIPDQYVLFPDFSGDLAKPAIAFGGDNRAWYEIWGSNRSWNMAEVHFGTGAHILNYREMGATHKYKCTPFLTGCTLVASATEDVTKISGVTQAGATRAVVGQFVSAKNPLVSIAPAIDGTAYWDLKRGGSSVKALHDLMPRHQLWYGNAWAQAWLAWQNDFYALPCLYGVAGCVANVNVQF